MEQTLFNWAKANRQGLLKGADSKPINAEQMTIARLRAELARVKMERDILGKATAYFAKVEVKYTFIQRHRQVWPITVQCGAVEVSVSGYHAHRVRKASSAPRRHLSDEALLGHIEAVHAQTRGSHGRPRILRELRHDGVRVGKRRLPMLMRKHGIRARGKKRFKVTTDSNHDLPIAQNLLDRQFTVLAPDTIWTGDITYIATDGGWLFLPVIVDLFSRQVVGWSMRLDVARDIVIDAVRTAWFKHAHRAKAT